MEMMRGGGRSQNGAVEVQNISANNLLQGFIITSNQFCYKESENGETKEEAKKREEEEDEIELSLGLSLNGQFGTDPRSRKRKNFELGRSSSIPEGFIFDEHRYGRGGRDLQLDRTRSLPVETDLEMEAKRKRLEKTRAFLEFNVPEKKGEDGQRYRFAPKPVNEKGRTVNTMKKNLEVSGMEKARNILDEMPCVSTRDVGADGKRVEGFLYWYGGNKEEVKIVCVCHGSFLSPAEFVRHGGGGSGGRAGDDIATNPLRHIVVKLPNSSL